MGLDMYLIGKKYFWSGEGPDKIKADKIKELFAEAKDYELRYVEFEVGYWRKSNHIHKWFVDNVQEGEDDCGNYYVSREQLIKLQAACIAVLKHRELGKELLPTVGGFFFGPTEYDVSYYEDIKSTITIIDKALKLSEEWDFEYHSSW